MRWWLVIQEESKYKVGWFASCKTRRQTKPTKKMDGRVENGKHKRTINYYVCSKSLCVLVDCVTRRHTKFARIAFSFLVRFES